MNRSGCICELIFSVLISLFFSCQSQQPLSINIMRVSPRVIVLNLLGVNVTAINSQSGIILIDTNRSPRLMAELKKIIEKEFSQSDFQYVINTHGHSDHSGGNQLFPDSVIIAQQNCPEYMRQNSANTIYGLWYPRNHLTELITQLGEVAKGSSDYQKLQAEINARQILLEDLENGYRVTVPGKTFRDSLIMVTAGLTLKMLYVGNAHTNHDIVVFIPEVKLLFTGDLFNDRDSFSFAVNKMVDAERLMLIIDRILREIPEGLIIVPGHDDFLSSVDLHALRDQLQEQYSEFADRNSATVTLEKMIEENGLEFALKNGRKLLREKESDYYWSEDELNTLGQRLQGKGKIAAGLEVCKLAVEAFPNSALAYDNLGRAYIRTGEIQLAIESYERSLHLAPYNRNAEEILKILHE